MTKAEPRKTSDPLERALAVFHKPVFGVFSRFHEFRYYVI
jgi:hypothetical protein